MFKLGGTETLTVVQFQIYRKHGMWDVQIQRNRTPDSLIFKYRVPEKHGSLNVQIEMNRNQDSCSNSDKQKTWQVGCSNLEKQKAWWFEC